MGTDGNEKFLEKPFPDLVKEIRPDVKWKKEPRFCPDQYVGKVGLWDKKASDFTKNGINERKKAREGPTERCIILILESPHKKEFEGEPGPAKGTTGRMIRSHILKVEGFAGYSEHGLILLNAIQYQCSLGHPPSENRDPVFRYVWIHGGEKSFIYRLKNMFRANPNRDDVIVNCCTMGKTKLHLLVQKAIKEALPEAKPLCRYHPSNWFREDRRKKLSY